ncbi:hypothetical protein [Methanoregula sp. PtaU1.Bin006]|uniref:hypothetical protein n=1 Tax=Methanoregula sp. PtaU1.Bin006 TaxID=1811681 RepID=UPI0025EACD74|nr:hypothetical protein [Methanoregula sp. PtaU1.Bin006]
MRKTGRHAMPATVAAISPFTGRTQTIACTIVPASAAMTAADSFRFSRQFYSNGDDDCRNDYGNSEGRQG